MIKLKISILLIFIIVGCSSSVNSLNYVYNRPQNTSNLFVINGNDNFKSIANNEGWSGQGTISSPLIISNLNTIQPLKFEIDNTSLYFEIKNYNRDLNNNFTITLRNVSNGWIVNNNFYENNNYIPPNFFSLVNCSNIYIASNYFNLTANSVFSIINSSNIIIENNNFRPLIATLNLADDLINTNNSQVLNNNFSNVFVIQKCQNDTFVNNLFTPGSMSITYSNHLNITSNKFFNSQFLVGHSNHDYFIKNKFNQSSIFFGSNLYDQILNNVFYNDYSLDLILDNNTNIIGNQIVGTNTVESGINTLWSYNVSIIDNIINNYASGIITCLQCSSIIKNNTIYNNYQVGIEFESNSIISNNRIFNDTIGIKVLGSNNIIEENILYNNSQDGIMLGGTKNIVRENLLFNNKVGIDVYSSDSTISYNRLYGNEQNILNKGSKNAIFNNTIQTNENEFLIQVVTFSVIVLVIVSIISISLYFSYVKRIVIKRKITKFFSKNSISPIESSTLLSCKNCGLQLEENSIFCSNCGTELKKLA